MTATRLQKRSRLQAWLILAIFAAPVIAALALGLAGWAPRGHSYGEHIQPERDLAAMSVKVADGKPFAFRNHAAIWTLVALPGPDCAQRCLRKLDLVHRAQITLGRHADKLRLLYLGAPPMSGGAATGFAKAWTVATSRSDDLEDLRASARDSLSAVLVAPDGTALLHYATGFDPEGLRQDLRKVVH